MKTQNTGFVKMMVIMMLSAMLVSFLPAACISLNGNIVIGSDAHAATKAKPKALFKVIKPNKKYRSYTLSNLKKFKLGRIKVEGKYEEGPRLMDVLKNAGVKKYSKVTLTGRDGSITRTAKQNTKNVLLDFTNHGTVKFCSTDVPKKQWIHDITEIKVAK